MSYFEQYLKYNTKMKSKAKKILEEIHPLAIIKEVEKWPVLYAKDSSDRNNTHFKIKIWHEVAKEVFPDWHSYSREDKDIKVSDLMKKWRNLRDTWKRHVEIEKKISEGLNIKKKVYVYYHHMAFLLPHLQAGDSEPEDGPAPLPAMHAPEPAPETAPETAPEPAPPVPTPPLAPLSAPPRAPLSAPPLAPLSAPPAKRRKLKHSSSCVHLEDIDEDKHFLMSLIPSFRKMNEDEKLTVKMEILRAIKGVRDGSISSQVNFNYEVVDSLGFAMDIDTRGDGIKKEVCINEDDELIDLEAEAVNDDGDEGEEYIIIRH
ncbi:uncharacterized protein LOC114350947 [Ostrinia furnacalis]|uniref:uncharacterized protein LOC114350947 n=1 Tax=Ostrinia furnacalis TaxID=93504 RepID=UPI00103E759E|nr:uncharacterized protein LOC114350947 [Ostrinia furnacalis]